MVFFPKQTKLIKDAVKEIRRICLRKGLRMTKDNQPSVGLISGTGFGGSARVLSKRIVIPFSEIPNFPSVGVKGHAGKLELGYKEGVFVAALVGRVHLFEGFTPAETVLPVRVLCALGVRTLIITSAVGSTSLNHKPGTLACVKDYINNSGLDPICGSDEFVKLVGRDQQMFLDPQGMFAQELREHCATVASMLKIPMGQDGVYVMRHGGRTFETAAEVRMIRSFGGDFMGMSLVHEAIAARHMGVKRILGLVCVSNYGAGIGGRVVAGETLSHTAVLRVIAEQEDNIRRLLGAVIAGTFCESLFTEIVG